MLSSIFTVSLAQSAIELGCIYALVALALFVSFSILNIADLPQTDVLPWDVLSAQWLPLPDTPSWGFWLLWGQA